MADDESNAEEKDTLKPHSSAAVKDGETQKDKVDEDRELNELLDSGFTSIFEISEN